jgi:S-adenosylmethionine hydrolase
VPGGVEGEVAFVDTFGNLISNIPASLLASPPGEVLLAGRSCIPLRWVRTYGEASPGETVVLVSSDGFLEVAVAGGSAATRFGVGEGTPLVVRWAA